MKVHTFYDSGMAYDATQTEPDIVAGSIVMVPRERIVGFLWKAWPVAVTVAVGHLHWLTDGWEDECDEDEMIVYGAARERARNLADELGWELR